MGKTYDYIKRRLVNFKLDGCCWFVPIKVGLFITGYLNLSSAIISLLGLADDSFAPIIMQVQMTILEDNAKKPIPVLAYSAELAFTVILLTALYRKDIPLLRVYLRYCICALVGSIMFYSMVVAVVGVIVGFLLVMSILFQAYVVLLVRSVIVEIKLEQRSVVEPVMVMSSIIKEAEETKVTDVEAPSESDSDSEKIEGDKKDKLETVDEDSKEESSSSDDDDEKEKK